MSVRIIGTGSYLPKKVADNNFLSTIVDTDDEWIRQRTGIKERHLSKRRNDLYGCSCGRGCTGKCRDRSR